MTLLASLKTERLKQKRRLSFLFLLVPLAVELFVIGSGFDTDKLSDGWMMQFYYMPLTNGMCLPVIIALYASRIADIEHKGGCLNLLYTVMPKRSVFFIKLLYGLGGIALMCAAEAVILLVLGAKSGFGSVPVKDFLYWTLAALLWTVGLFVAAGRLAGLPEALPRELGEWILLGMLGSAAICSVQTFLSLTLRSFMAPVGISCAGGFLGLMATANHFPYILPWSLMSIGMHANNPHFELNYPAFLAGVMINAVLWLTLSYILLVKADVRTSE